MEEKRMIKSPFRSVKNIGMYVGKLIDPLCKKQGFIGAQILLDWNKIVGVDFSKICRAIRVTFPFGSRQGGCLYVQTTSSLSLAIAYLEPSILEKANQYYGYRALAKIKILQGSVAPDPEPKQKKRGEKGKPLPITGIHDERLREALESLSCYFNRVG